MNRKRQRKREEGENITRVQSGGKRYNIPYLYCCCVCRVLLNIEHSVYFGVFIFFFGGNQAFPIDYISKMDYFHCGDDTTFLRMLKRYNSENVSFVQHFWKNALNLLEIFQFTSQ